MQPYTTSNNSLQNLLTMLVRVIAKSGKNWLLDPQLLIAQLWDMLWLYAQQPFSRMMWDPRGWFWTNSMMDPLQKVPFFQYNVKLDITLSMSKNTPTLVAQKNRNKWGVSSAHLKAYSTGIWSFKGPTKYILFQYNVKLWDML